MRYKMGVPDCIEPTLHSPYFYDPVTGSIGQRGALSQKGVGSKFSQIMHRNKVLRKLFYLQRLANFPVLQTLEQFTALTKAAARRHPGRRFLFGFVSNFRERCRRSLPFLDIFAGLFRALREHDISRIRIC